MRIALDRRHRDGQCGFWCSVRAVGAWEVVEGHTAGVRMGKATEKVLYLGIDAQGGDVRS